MKIFILLIFGVALSEQYFWFEKSPDKPDSEEPMQHTSGTLDNRFIMNILTYKTENGTDTTPVFSCLGTLIAADYALAPADCVKLQDPYKTAIQFVIDDYGDVGPSILLKRVEVIVHDDFKLDDTDSNNIALIKFYPQGISVNPPIFEHFYPIERGSLPQLSYCKIIGRKIHLAVPPEEKVLINGPGCCGINSQAYCTVFDDSNHPSCSSHHGAPVICDNMLAGFMLKKSSACVDVDQRIMMKFHSVANFDKWIEYYVKGLFTESPLESTTTTPQPDSAASIKLSISLMIFVSFLIAFK